MTPLTERLVRKGRSMSRDLRVLWPYSEERTKLVPWLLTSGKWGFEDRLCSFNAKGLKFEVRGRDVLGLREILIEEEYDFAPRLIRDIERPVVADLGANVGLFAVLLFMANDTACVHSYEPSSTTFDVLARNAHANGDLDWNVHHAAVHSDDGQVSFTNMPFSTGSRVTAAGDEKVPAVSLLTVVDRLGGYADLVKMDVEGSEEAALADQAPVLASVRSLVLEIHPERCDAERVWTVVNEAYPYRYRALGRRSSKPLIVATHEPLVDSSLEPLTTL